MNKTARKWGVAASLAALILMGIYMACLAGILAVNPLYIWDGYEGYLLACQTTNQGFKYLAMGSMFIYGLVFVVQVSSLDACICGERKFFSTLARGFSYVFCGLIGMHYFVQLTSVRLQLAGMPYPGLVQWIQANPIAGMSAVNMLGWTSFYGLSNLFIGLSVEKKEARWFRRVFVTNACMMGLGALGYMLQITPLTFIAMNIGLGCAMVFGTMSLYRYFQRDLES